MPSRAVLTRICTVAVPRVGLVSTVGPLSVNSGHALACRGVLQSGLVEALALNLRDLIDGSRLGLYPIVVDLWRWRRTIARHIRSEIQLDDFLPVLLFEGIGETHSNSSVRPRLH
jgi:hypothetical protein